MTKTLKTVTRAKNGTKKSKTMSATEQEFASALSNELPVTISTALVEKTAPIYTVEEVTIKMRPEPKAKKVPAIKSTEPIRNIRAFCSTYVRNLRRDQFGNPMTALAAAFEKALV